MAFLFGEVGVYIAKVESTIVELVIFQRARSFKVIKWALFLNERLVFDGLLHRLFAAAITVLLRRTGLFPGAHAWPRHLSFFERRSLYEKLKRGFVRRAGAPSRHDKLAEPVVYGADCRIVIPGDVQLASVIPPCDWPGYVYNGAHRHLLKVFE